LQCELEKSDPAEPGRSGNASAFNTASPERTGPGLAPWHKTQNMAFGQNRAPTNTGC